MFPLRYNELNRMKNKINLFALNKDEKKRPDSPIFEIIKDDYISNDSSQNTLKTSNSKEKDLHLD